MRLLQRVTMWRLRAGVSWIQIRNTYAHILRRIEDREITWEEDFDKYERSIYERVTTTQIKTEKAKSSQPGRTGGESTWFCRNFQKPEGCSREAPHPGRVGNQIRSLQHICVACWLKDKTKRQHSESSSDCPNKEQ